MKKNKTKSLREAITIIVFCALVFWPAFIVFLSLTVRQEDAIKAAAVTCEISKVRALAGCEFAAHQVHAELFWTEDTLKTCVKQYESLVGAVFKHPQ